jgi:hypothetical protein
MGDLFINSEPDESFQRNLISEHRDEMVEFLNSGEYLFFPELILGLVLADGEQDLAKLDTVFEALASGENLSRTDFGRFALRSSVSKLQGTRDIRTEEKFHRATLEISDQDGRKILSRIDGNHRLSATPFDPKFSGYNVPYCVILFRDDVEAKRYSRALFHNINYKQIPLTLEQNLRLIVDDHELFSDEDLQSPPFGWPYYVTRKLLPKVDFELVPELERFVAHEPRTFLLKHLEMFLDMGIVGANENAIRRFKAALSAINGLLAQHTALVDCRNPGLLGALLCYQLKAPRHCNAFLRWIIVNHLYLVQDSNSSDFVKIFDRILESKIRKIFVSMPFGKDLIDDHFGVISRVCKEISDHYGLKPPLEAQRVDWFSDGTSYPIDDKILDMISNCGLLIGDLTFANVNVYHEIGFAMGKARVEGLRATNMLLILNSTATQGDSSVGFNLRGINQLRFTKTETLAELLRANLEQFFGLQAVGDA